jgi:hypothetical protein
MAYVFVEANEIVMVTRKAWSIVANAKSILSKTTRKETVFVAAGSYETSHEESRLPLRQ